MYAIRSYYGLEFISLFYKDLEEVFQSILSFVNENYPNFLEKIEFVKGFLNFYIKEEFWQKNFQEKLQNDDLIEAIRNNFV